MKMKDIQTGKRYIIKGRSRPALVLKVGVDWAGRAPGTPGARSPFHHILIQPGPEYGYTTTATPGGVMREYTDEEQAKDDAEQKRLDLLHEHAVILRNVLARHGIEASRAPLFRRSASVEIRGDEMEKLTRLLLNSFPREEVEAS